MGREMGGEERKKMRAGRGGSPPPHFKFLDPPLPQLIAGLKHILTYVSEHCY